MSKIMSNITPINFFRSGRIKTFVLLISFFSFMFVNSSIYALDGTGTVDEIMICTDSPGSWFNYGLFKLSDGNWFGIYLNKHDKDLNDDNAIYATVLFAKATNSQVTVRANSSIFTKCGISAAYFYATVGDFIRVQ